MKFWLEKENGEPVKPKQPCERCGKKVWLWWTTEANWKKVHVLWQSEHLCQACFKELTKNKEIE